MEQKELLLNRIEDYIKEATNEEIDTLTSIINSLNEKNEGKQRTYLSALMQLERRFLENGDYEVRIPVAPLIYNAMNIVHGGITATILDIGMGQLVNRSLPEHLAAVTAELKINYLKPGVGKELICIASIVHKGSSFYVCEAKVYNEKQKLIAMGTGSFFIVKQK